MKILFCGSYMPPNQIKYFNDSSEAANNFQFNLINNLSKNNRIEILSYIGFPITKDLSQKLIKSLKSEKINYIIRYGFLSRIVNFIHYYMKFIKLITKCDTVLLYNYYYINLFILPISKFFNKKTILIVADYTEISEYNCLTRKTLAKITKKDYLKFDKLIILSNDLYKNLAHKNKLFFPGAIGWNKFEKFSLKNSEKIRILYSGLLNEVTGVDLLLDAIKKVSLDNIEFIFTGRGAMQSDVQNLSKEDRRVLYKGFVSRDQYYELLDSVDIVVNPRNMNLQQNQNNFPSKIMEYLASGRIIVSTKFSGYRDFYDCIEFTESKPDDIAEKIEKIIKGKDKIYDREEVFDRNRRKAQLFDWSLQTEKIEEFI